MEKSKEKKPRRKHNLATLISTALIIVISVLSVTTVFMLSDLQTNAAEGKTKAEKYGNLLSAIEVDMEAVLDLDYSLQQLSVLYLQEFILLNETIGAMYNYNLSPTVNISQAEIDMVAIQAALKIKQINALINQTIAYQYGTMTLYMGPANNYSIWVGMDSIDYFFIDDVYRTLKPDLSADLLYWIDQIYNTTEYDPEILQIKLINWETYMYNDTNVVNTHGKFASDYAYVMQMAGLYVDLNYDTYYDIYSTEEEYIQIANVYEQAAEIMTTSFILLAISAVIIAFAVSIVGRKYIWVTIVIGILVTGISIYMYTQGLYYANLAESLIVLEEFMW